VGGCVVTRLMVTMSVQFNLSVLTSLASLTEHMMVGTAMSDMSPLFRIISLGVL